MSNLISKTAVIEILSTMQGRCGTRAALVQNSKIWQQVKDMPTVDAEPIRHGHWIMYPFSLEFDITCLEDDVVCSNCKKQVELIALSMAKLYKFCPYCGAKMDEVNKREEIKDEQSD